MTLFSLMPDEFTLQSNRVSHVSLFSYALIGLLMTDQEERAELRKWILPSKNVMYTLVVYTKPYFILLHYTCLTGGSSVWKFHKEFDR